MLKKLFKNRQEWRKWLENNHSNEPVIWLVFYKLKTKKESVTYEEAVEEALCFGWIDSTVKRIDDEKHMQKYTPRKIKSNWSASNKARVKKLIKNGLMTEFGLRAIDTAKRNGSWNRLDSVEIRMESPNDFKMALAKDKLAKSKFDSLAPSRKKQFLYWITSAKRDETRKRRINETIKLLLADKPPGYKET